MNQYINLTLDNIEYEHLSCTLENKYQEGIHYKKEWLKKRIPEGHIFRKLDVDGRVFIEYAPIETAWAPICGNNYMYIYCLWVSGDYKGYGYGKELLEYAIEDSKKKGKNGICAIALKEKKPFLSADGFYKKYGFKVVDTIGDYELLALPFYDDKLPSFNKNAKAMKINKQVPTIYYTPLCPFVLNNKMEIENYAKENQKDIHFIEIDSLHKAKNAPCVINNWALFVNGQFVSNTVFFKMIKDVIFDE